MSNGKNPARGSCVISEEVVTGIASEAALEVEGVAAMAPARANEIRDFVTAPIGKTVRFSNEADATVIDVSFRCIITSAFRTWRRRCNVTSKTPCSR